MYHTKTLRGTIFCPPVKYTKDFVNALSDVCEGYVPVIVRDNGALPVLPTWQLSSPDEKEVLLFNGEKIDLVRLYETVISDDVVRFFSERCKQVFSKVLHLTGHYCTRIALAPSIVIAEKGMKATSLFDRLFAVREFQGVLLDTSNLSQVYRVNESIGAKEITVNHVANFHADNELVAIGGVNQIRERYMGDFDINTMVNPEYKFSVESINDFFDKAPSLFASFYRLYFE